VLVASPIKSQTAASHWVENTDRKITVIIVIQGAVLNRQLFCCKTMFYNKYLNQIFIIKLATRPGFARCNADTKAFLCIICMLYTFLLNHSIDGRFGKVVGILAYCTRGRGFDSRTVQTFVCMNMSVCIGSGCFDV
jgi:hypothetical protein